MSKNNREDTAVARIQALQRGRIARKSADRRRRSLLRREATARWELEQQAATKIQAACRGARHRTKRARYREQQIAGAPNIQAANREDKAREEANKAFPGGSLSLTEIRKGLHTLGRNPHDMRYCYVGLMAANAGVFGIDAIANFPLLQNVNLSENHISSVKPLSKLPFLQDLDISRNCLTSLLDYELFEGEDFSWRASEERLNDWRSEVVRSESMLHRVNASFNSIASIGDLTHHRNLQELDLSHNSVEVLQGLSALKCLRILKLSHNIIRRIEGLDDLPLVEIDLDHNAIERVENVGTDKLPNLRVLRLGFNSILSLSDLTNCQLLAILDVRSNKISAVRQVEYLQGCLNLHTLVLEGNPMEHLEAYRARVIFRLQGLTLLDRNKESETVPEGNGPFPQHEKLGSGQPTLEKVYRMLCEAMDSRFDKIYDELRTMEHHIALVEHGARQPRLAMEADGQANTKTRERTEGATTAVQAMRRDSFSARWVEPNPNTNSTSFGVEVEPAALPCRDGLPSLEMRSSTAAGGLVPTGKTSTATETSSNQPPLRFCALEETGSKMSPKETNQRTSTLYTSYDSSVFQETNLSAAPSCRRVVGTESRKNTTFDPGGSHGHLRACPYLGSWDALVCDEAVCAGAAGKDCSSFLEHR